MNSPFAILSLIICIPFLGMLFTLTAKEDIDKKTHNSFNVAVFSIIANLVMIWRGHFMTQRPHLTQMLSSICARAICVFCFSLKLRRLMAPEGQTSEHL